MGKDCPGRGKNTCEGPEAAMIKVFLKHKKEITPGWMALLVRASFQAPEGYGFEPQSG